jgi:hypothetical protein
MGDATSGRFRLSFNPQLRVELQGATVTSDAGLLLLVENSGRLVYLVSIGEVPSKHVASLGEVTHHHRYTRISDWTVVWHSGSRVSSCRSSGKS